jgi:hypothetical protein
MRRLTRERLTELLAEAEHHPEPADHETRSVPAPAKVQAALAQGQKVAPTLQKAAPALAQTEKATPTLAQVAPTLRNVQPIVAKAQPLIRPEATKRQALHAKARREVPQPRRRLDRLLSCGRPAARPTAAVSRDGPSGSGDNSDDPEPAQRGSRVGDTSRVLSAPCCEGARS